VGLDLPPGFLVEKSPKTTSLPSVAHLRPLAVDIEPHQVVLSGSSPARNSVCAPHELGCARVHRQSVLHPAGPANSSTGNEWQPTSVVICVSSTDRSSLTGAHRRLARPTRSSPGTVVVQQTGSGYQSITAPVSLHVAGRCHVCYAQSKGEHHPDILVVHVFALLKLTFSARSQSTDYRLVLTGTFTVSLKLAPCAR
jgi:hypothetical protein